MSRTRSAGRALLAWSVAAMLWIGPAATGAGEEFKILTKQEKIYLAIGGGAALPYRLTRKGAPLRIEVEGPRTLPLEARCVLGKSGRKRGRSVGCRLRVRLGGKVLGRLQVKARADENAQFQDEANQRPSLPGSLELEVPEGAQVLTVEVLMSRRGGVALWLGKAPAEPVGETLPMLALAPVAPKAKPPETKPEKKPAEGDIELVPLVIPELDEKSTPTEDAAGSTSPQGPSGPSGRSDAPATREDDADSSGAPPRRPPETAPASAPPHRPPRAEAAVSASGPDEDAILALGPKVGVLVPLSGVGGDPTWLVGVEVRLVVPGTAEMLALGVGAEFYPITTTGRQGHTDFVLETWVLPVTASLTFTPLPDTIVSPVLGAGLGAYIGSTRFKGERGATEDSGVSAAFGFYLLGGLEFDLGKGGGLLAEARWARATGDMGSVVENADLGGLTVDLRYRYLF